MEPPERFSNICANRICRTRKLLTNRVFGKIIPLNDQLPNLIGEFFSGFQHAEFFKFGNHRSPQ